MATSPAQLRPSSHARSGSRRLPRVHAGSRVRALRAHPELLALLVLAAALDLWGLSKNGDANTYYSAALKGMASDWHLFLYGSFDPAGLQTFDKPPAALWVQALSVRVFGFSSWSFLVPQALMGVASVGLIYDAVRRPFGRAAGAAGGLALALTPIAVAISRHNNPDALLVLCSVAALWATVRALQTGRTRWLVGAGIAVGIGFETKMGAALLVVPGLAAAYLWVAPRGRLAAVRSLAAGGAAMLVVGLAWPVLVWLTPAADRPWISGTDDNSIWSLILGYNGLGRLAGQSGGPGGAMGGGGGGVFGGDTGVLRLLNSSLGGQAGWLLGAALVAAIALTVATRLRRTDVRTGWLIATGGAFAISAVAFSFASGIFHPYYVSALAPFSAALVGGGVGLVLSRGLVARVTAPLLVAGGMVTTLVVLRESATELGWLVPVTIAVGALSAAALAALEDPRIRRAALGIGIGVLLVGPAIWSVQTLGHATSSTFPAGGPASAGIGGGFGGGGGGGGTPPGGTTRGTGGGTTGATQARSGAGGGGMFGGTDLTATLATIKAHGGGTLVVESQQGAATSILSSDASVAGIGGFSGRESTVSASWLADRVAAGDVRWVSSSGSSPGMGNDGRAGSSAAITAATKACTAVSSGLYDCAGKADAIRAAAAA